VAHFEVERAVKINPRYYRPAEVEQLLGDSRKAEEVLGWKSKTKFEDLLKIMIKADYELESKKAS
jgi:GDPmannose 4,6-dehydratase